MSLRTARKAVGWLLLATPMVGLFALLAASAGIWAAFGVYAASACIIGVLMLGLHLIEGA